MSKSEIRQIIITIAACVLTGAAVLFILRSSNKKIAVVDAVKLFNDYKMKRELEAKEAVRLQYLARQADSIRQIILVKSKSTGTSQKELQALYQSFNAAKATLEQEYQESNQSINEQVWKRLNPAVDAYGKERGFRLIIGANGMGSVLYNDDFYDKTKEVIDFVNKQYEEGN